MTPSQSSNSAAKWNFPLILTTSFVSALIMLDSNVVAVSLPAVGMSLHASFADMQWVISAYVLAYSSLLLPAGSFADLCGRRKAMIFGLVIFAVASAACGFARTALLLNIARAVQGVGGALLLTSSLAAIASSSAGELRSRAFAFWGASLGVALTAGPIVGGAITSFFGWRWIFLVNLPLCAGLIAAALVTVPESYDKGAKRFDISGSISFSGALGLLVWALIDGNEESWASWSIVGRLLGAAALFACFVVVEMRQQRAMVDFSLFRNRTFVGSVAAMITYGASAQVMIFFLPLFLQNAYQFSPAIAGLAMLPFAIPMVVVPRVIRGIAARLSGRNVLTLGLAATTCGNLLFWLIARENSSYSIFLGAMLLAGVGAGILNGETVKVMQGAVPSDRAGMASGLASTTRFLGILIAIAGLGAVLSNVTHNSFVLSAGHIGISRQVALEAAKSVSSGNIDSVLAVTKGVSESAVRAASESAFSSGFSAAALGAALTSAVGCLLTYLLVSGTETAPARYSKPDKDDLGSAVE